MSQLSELIRMRPPAAASHGADFLIKMNLPPIMGRRDAACDCIGTLLKTDFMAMPEEDRRMEYERLIQLLLLAITDTLDLLRMLTNLETRSREEWLLSFFQLLGQVLEPLHPLSQLEETLCRNSASIEELLEDCDWDFEDACRRIQGSERSLVNRLRQLYSAAEGPMNRYREYTGKSFSKPFAERYEKAYQEYRNLCRQDF